jgi:FHA domain
VAKPKLPQFLGQLVDKVRAEGQTPLGSLDHPVLVVDPLSLGQLAPGSSQTPDGSKVPDGLASENTTASFRMWIAMQDPTAGGLPRLDSPLLPVTKSDRNPFAGLITVGRGPRNDVHLATSSVSKNHAWFRLADEAWQLRDVGSTNGTMINGVTLAAEVDQALESGSQVRFGDVSALFLTPADLLTLCNLLGKLDQE